MDCFAAGYTFAYRSKDDGKLIVIHLIQFIEVDECIRDVPYVHHHREIQLLITHLGIDVDGNERRQTIQLTNGNELSPRDDATKQKGEHSPLHHIWTWLMVNV